MTVKLSEEYRAVVEAIASKAELDPELLVSLLDLEADHTNLHGWGARPALRRDVASILDQAIAQGAAEVETGG